MISPWCTVQTVEAMAEAGWRQDQIEQLEREVELAKRKAEAASYANGDTKARQEQLVKRAEKEARDIAHDRWHRELGESMTEINALNAFVAENPDTHYGADVALKALAAADGKSSHELLPGGTKKKKGA